MSVLVVTAKALLLVLFAMTVFTTLAIFLDFEPTRDTMSICRKDIAPICLFTIF